MKVTISPGCARSGSPALVIAGSTTTALGVPVTPGGVVLVTVGVFVESVPVLVAVLVELGVFVTSVPVLVAVLVEVGVSVASVPVLVLVLVGVSVTV